VAEHDSIRILGSVGQSQLARFSWTIAGSARMDHQSEMCATPNDQPGDQKNQRQKNQTKSSAE
jgi:hypothetical protein